MKNKNSVWFDNSTLPTEMVNGALGKNGWKRLEESWHFPTLASLINSCSNSNSLADVGCGAGEVGRVFSNFNYVGFDLPHIINEVAKKVNPNLEFSYFDADDKDYTFLEKFDIILCNSFLSELVNPLEVIQNILPSVKNYFIIHRQKISENQSLSKYQTYGGLNTTESFLSLVEIEKILINHKIVDTIKTNEFYSFLIKKI